ncbi:MAG: DUF3301 domain-containing protein [Gammaproteobacteria bacterium]|nr:DUF3301 domain-containing protein [Gammaproteobacteria bacterium]MBU1655273.1 DUF3301 domain-containing protein [Gammaproteobacteria bacterium]MBU1962052.1 DUF3301 domain-containing protein [Gammaproteobacteria bacterium]
MYDSGLLLLIIVVGILWFWLDNARAKELATTQGSRICRQHNLQFLEETAVLRATSLRRTPGGLRLQREFAFEYTEEGMTRHRGSIILIGTRVHHFELEGTHWLEAEAEKETNPIDPTGSNVVPFKPREPS